MNIMSKFKKILEFILALLNFLFHFKPSSDDKEKPESVESYPRPLPSGPAWTVPLFETLPKD